MKFRVLERQNSMPFFFFFIIAYVLNCQKQNTMEYSIAKLGKLGT